MSQIDSRAFTAGTSERKLRATELKERWHVVRAMNPKERMKEIRRRLTEAFEPDTLGVEDESYLHEGHEGARDGRGHFRVLIIAQAFADQSLLHRHRMVYKALGDLMRTDIHALAIDAWAPDELDR